jgi:hypothetical protein
MLMARTHYLDLFDSLTARSEKKANPIHRAERRSTPARTRMGRTYEHNTYTNLIHLQEGSADAVACLPVPPALVFYSFCLVASTAFLFKIGLLI